jgi:hypothetical protein
MFTRRIALSAAAVTATVIVTAVGLGASPAAAFTVDPSAFGLAASGPTVLSAQPAVDWNAGQPLAASASGIDAGPITAGPLAVAAGSGFAAAEVADLSIGPISITILSASCLGGQLQVSVRGTAAGVPLTPGRRVQLPGGYAQIGVVTQYPDGSASIAGLVAVLGEQQITAAVARC